MTLTFLGTGTSVGVPSLGCKCAVCQSNDSHDKRLRSCALLETSSTRLLIDCGPDIRTQLMSLDFTRIDGVLLTHIHYDHVGGIDDLRPFCSTFGDIDIYASHSTTAGLRHNMPYCFTRKLYPGVPRLRLHEIKPHDLFRVGDIDIMPFSVLHGRLPILGFRIGSFAYITDMKSIPSTELPFLYGLDTLVVNALRWQMPHHSHMLVGEALDFVEQIAPHRVFFTHLAHGIGFHSQTNAILPQNVNLAYDGQKICL